MPAAHIFAGHSRKAAKLQKTRLNNRFIEIFAIAVNDVSHFVSSQNDDCGFIDSLRLRLYPAACCLSALYRLANNNLPFSKILLQKKTPAGVHKIFIIQHNFH